MRCHCREREEIVIHPKLRQRAVSASSLYYSLFTIYYLLFTIYYLLLLFTITVYYLLVSSEGALYVILPYDYQAAAAPTF